MSRANAEVGSAANSYEILAKLAVGGMAEIFLARGQSTAGVERYVVLKRVLRDRAADPNFIRMFLDEARLAAQLQHPNIAQVYDIGKLGDSFFFTMEYVHGETVRTLLQRSHGLRRPISLSSVLTIVAGAAAGLHHAHDRKGMDGKPLGIVHRDVSPSNLMVSYEGTVKVVDFGVAKAAHRDTETRSGTVKGKIAYMSPEQCKGGDIDRRSDLFSLGIVMWEMLTTERLFRRNSDFENMQAIVAEDVPPPSSLRPEISPELDAVVMKLLAKLPANRYQDADEVHEAIEAVAVRTGSALSASSLGRFMRELFGQRPEPWIELQSIEQQPEAFTVTSEPLAAVLPSVSPVDELDLRLSAIPELSRVNIQAEPSSQPIPMPPPHPAPMPGMPTIPLRVHADAALNRFPRAATTPPVGVSPIGGGTPSNVAPLNASGFITVAMPSQVTGPVMPMQASQATGPVPSIPPTTLAGQMPPQPGSLRSMTPSAVNMMRPHTPSTTPPSNPGYPVLNTSGSVPSYGALHQTAPPKRSRALIILIPAAIVGVVIGIVMATGGDDKKPDDSASSAPNTVALTPGPREAAPISGSGSAAGSAAVVAPPDEIEIDPTPVDPTPVDPKVEPTPVNAKVEPTPVDPKPPVEKARPPTTPPPTTPAVDLAALFKTSKYGEVVAQCASSRTVVASNPTTCTLSACKVKDSSKARKWFTSVAAPKRYSVLKDCGGVLPSEKTQSEDCKRDPLACQH